MEKYSKENPEMKHLKERWHLKFSEDIERYVIRDTTGFNILQVCRFLPGDRTGQLTAEYLVAQHNASLPSDEDRRRFKTAAARLETPRRKGDVCRGAYIVDHPDGGVNYLNKDGTWRYGASDVGCWWYDVDEANAFLTKLRKEYVID